MALAYNLAAALSSTPNHSELTDHVRIEPPDVEPEEAASSTSGEAVPTQDLLGKRLGDFIVRQRLGEGGFGEVYLAEQPLLEREAAIKVLRSERRKDEGSIQAFLREARLASRLDHPYAAHIYAFGAEPDGLRWIAMERVRGTPLDEILEVQHHLPLDRFVPLLTRICEVVHAAHERGIIHCDLKPANVMVLSRSGRMLPKLLDFGIAKLAMNSDALTASIAGVATPETAHGDSGVGRPSTQGVGSPAYMAPEQWASLTGASGLADQYSLGICAYEVLTGRLPFRARSLIALRLAHSRKPLPSLGGGFPPALDEVLRRATAKQPEARFKNSLEFAEAFRAASGLAQETPNLPELDAKLRELQLGRAPRPLAEALAGLEAARNPHQAKDALWQVFHVAVRLIGILALAGRTRLGAAGGDAQGVIDAIRELRRRTLSDAEWVELARNLCRAFASKADAHPLPELVSFFFEEDGASSSRSRSLETMLGMQATIGSKAHSAEQMREYLLSWIPALEELLRALSFLCEYPWIINRAASAERWMGVRRPQPMTIELESRSVPEGQVALLSREGHPLLLLWPIVQSACPTPGVADELFLVEGKGTVGAKLVALPQGFERSDERVWTWLEKHFFVSKDNTESFAVEEHSPYRGLSAFGVDDAADFLGREREVEAFVNRIRIVPLLAVAGPSGAGKSSFVQAGVIPALPIGWRAITLRPGPSPMATLVSRLTREGIDARGASVEEVANRLRAYAREAGLTVVLVVDQFEELLTLCFEKSQRDWFASLMADCARSAEEPLRVIITVRDDFLLRVEGLPAMRGRLSQGLQLLTTPGPAELLRILVTPAKRAGYEFEDRDLPTKMVRAVETHQGALALLSFTASKLWERRDRHFKQIPIGAYEAMEGVGGALAQHAETVLTERPPEEQRAIREAFRHLVTVDGTRAVLTRLELTQVLGSGARAETVIEHLISARLLTASEGEGGQDRVEVTHETLLQSWPRLVRWRQEDAEGARLRGQLRSATRQWDERGRPRGLLWRDEALAEYRTWRARFPGELTEAEQAFAGASLREHVRGRWARRLALAAVIVGLSVGVLALLYENHRNHERVVALFEEQGRNALVNGDPMRAMVYLGEAQRQGARGLEIDSLLSSAIGELNGHQLTLNNGGRVLQARFSPDGRLIATSTDDGTIRIWDATTGTIRRLISAHTKEVWFIAFRSDGKHLLSASWDGTAAVWEVESGREVFRLKHDNAVMDARYSSDEQRIATASRDQTARVWSAATGQLLFTLRGHTDAVRTAIFGPGDRTIATVSMDYTARLWDSSGRLLRVLRAPMRLWRAAFSPRGDRLAVAGHDDGIAAVFDVETGQLISQFTQHTGMMGSVSFSPDGKLVLTAGSDTSAKIWRADNGVLVAHFDHSAPLNSAQFDRAGRLVVTASADGTTSLWDVEQGTRLWSYFGHAQEVWTANFSPDEKRLVTAALDGNSMVWDARQRKAIALLPAAGAVDSVAISRDGKRILTSTEAPGFDFEVLDRQTQRLLARVDRPLIRPLPKLQQGIVQFSPDDQRIVTISGSAILIRDGRTLAPVMTLKGSDALVWNASFSPNGAHILGAHDDNVGRVWDARTGRLLLTLRGHNRPLFIIREDPTGRRIATGAQDHQVRIWDAHSGASMATLSGHALDLYDAVFSADGLHLVTTSEDRTSRIWNVHTGQLEKVLEGHTSTVMQAAISPDGRLLATASYDGTVRLWTASGTLLGVVVRHAAACNAVVFSPDGKELVTASDDRTVGIWQVPNASHSVQEVRRILRCRIPLELEGDHIRERRLDCFSGGESKTEARRN